MKWIEEAFKGSWVVPLGPNVNEFEHLLGNYLGNPYVVALSAGTAALHLGLRLAMKLYANHSHLRQVPTLLHIKALLLFLLIASPTLGTCVQ